MIDVAGTPTTAASKVLGDTSRRGRPRRHAPSRSRRDRPRQAQHARVRLRRVDDEPPLRPGPEPVVARPDLRRLERRERRGDGGRPRRRDARNRHGRVDPDPVCLLRRDRRASLDRPGLEPRRRPGGAEPSTPSARSRDRRGLRAPPRRHRRARPRRPGERRRPVPPYDELLGEGVRGLRVGVVTSLVEGADPRVAEAVERRSPSSARSAPSSSPSPPLLEHAGTIQQAMQFPEATTVHLERLRTRLADYGADVRARLLVGLFVTPEVYETGKRAREAACDEIRRLFEQFDLLAAPAMPVLPPRIGEETVELGGARCPTGSRSSPTTPPGASSARPSPSSRAASWTGSRWGSPSSALGSARRSCSGPRTPSSRRPDWHERRPALATQSERKERLAGEQALDAAHAPVGGPSSVATDGNAPDAGGLGFRPDLPKARDRAPPSTRRRPPRPDRARPARPRARSRVSRDVLALAEESLVEPVLELTQPALLPRPEARGERQRGARLVAGQVDLLPERERPPVHVLRPVDAEVVAAYGEERLRGRPELERKPLDLDVAPVLGGLDRGRLEVRVRADHVVVEGTLGTARA